MAPSPSIFARLQRAALWMLCCALLTQSAGARAHGKSAVERAEQQREALEGRPQTQRTRAAYEHVLDAYRAIYHAAPASEEADAAVDAVASLLAEEGRAFHDAKLLHEAVEQYEYLRRNYPASHFRPSALLSEAEIAQSDLQDYATAQQSFAEFLRLYPGSPMAGEARQQLKALRHKEQAATASQGEADSASPTRAEQAARNAATHARELAELNGASNGALNDARPLRKTLAAPLTPSPTVDQPAAPETVTTSLHPMHSSAGKPILITGIRHWLTPVYTRVAIDLSDQVQYEAARVPDPDRIYFDLRGARLAPELIGKSIDVTDDGFLKRVRVAPSSGDATRVVLDVSHVSEYSAFFLPNPWRLIIDIHGAAATASKTQPAKTQPASASSTLPSNVTTPEPLPDTTAARATQDVISLARLPRRVRATKHPTTGPIAASVNGTTRAPQSTQKPNELDALATDEGSMNAGTVTAAVPPPIENPAPPVPAPPSRSHKRNAPAVSSPAPTTVPTDLTPQTPTLAAREATPTSSGERSLVRTLGLKINRIVIDAGHGGHDSGTLGPEGFEEKDVVLDVALRLGKLLKQRLGADVIYTRDDDTFVPLETRTAIANKAQADLFISVHANSSSDSSARGVEVYYLNFTTAPEALEVAARENAVSDQSIFQLSDLVKKITLKDKIDESHEFASDVESSLYSGLASGNEGLKDRGVKKAPFVVLIGANMPSILAEISFLTNPEDARQLRDPNYRERIAESLFRGTSRYVSGLSGVRLAQGGAHTY